MEERDKTKWKNWYWALILVLLAQIFLYSWITYSYSA